jgi:hypothetical protein
MAGGAESGTAALGVIDALWVTDAEATDDNCDADGVSAFRVLHWYPTETAATTTATATAEHIAAALRRRWRT